MESEYLNSFRSLEEKILKLDLSQYPDQETVFLDSLNSVELIKVPFTKIIPEFQRITVNRRLPNNLNTSINEVKYLKNPPPEAVKKYGRANLKNQSVLYATFMLPTAIMEMNPEVDDIITVSKWKTYNNNTSLTIYPVCDFLKTKNLQLKQVFESGISRYPADLQDIIIIDSCLIATYFSKPVEEGKEINYTFSAHLADKIFNKSFNGKIQAIIYPSVKDPCQSDNIALKPEIFQKMFVLDEVIESRVISKNHKNILLKRNRRTKNFDDTYIYW